MPRLPALRAASLAGPILLAPLLPTPATAQSSGQIGNLAQASGLLGGQGLGGGILPSVGTDLRMGNLRPQLENYFRAQAGGPSTTPAWLIRPSIGVDVGVTDNALRVSKAKGDVFTVVTPGLLLTGDTARLKVSVNYAPQVTVYATTKGQDQVNQLFNGQALGIIVPDAVFVDLRGSITQSSLTGNNIAQNTTTNVNRQNDVQTISFSITPYAEHRFGGWGTARLGYSFTRSLQDQQDQRVQANSISNLQALGTPGYGAVGNLTTQRERASFASGENFGRFNDLSTLEAIQYSGTGSYKGAYRNQFLNQLGYAVTRTVTALVGFGYQDIRYGGTPIVRINEPTYNFGARYAPNPDTTLTVLYGRRDGIAAVSFDGQFAPTARTRLIGRYSTGLTSDIEEAQNVLQTTTVGPTGLVTDSATGAPVGSGIGSGVQNGVFKLSRFSVTALLLQDRDSYSSTLSFEDRTTVTNTPALNGGAIIPSGTKSSNVSASLSWQHELAADLSSTVSAQYAISNSTSRLLVGSTGEQTTLSLTAALNKQFTETLSGSVRYTYTNQSGGQAGTQSITSSGALVNNGTYSENLFLVGLRKTF